jgi:hypothetical protein
MEEVNGKRVRQDILNVGNNDTACVTLALESKGVAFDVRKIAAVPYDPQSIVQGLLVLSVVPTATIFFKYHVTTFVETEVCKYRMSKDTGKYTSESLVYAMHQPICLRYVRELMR